MTVARMLLARTRTTVPAAALFVGATLAVALIGGRVSASGQDWYDTIAKPSFTPPGPTFGIVWPILYALIAVAGVLAWRSTPSPRPTVVWAVGLAVNLLWTCVFFGLERPIEALVVIVALLASIVLFMVVSYRTSRAAAWLFVPYLAWVSFATALNVGVVALN